MNKRLLSVVLVCGCLFHLAGCSTVVYGTKQKVKVDTIPSGASVILGGQQQTTPAVYSLSGKSGYDLVANKPGYKTSYAHVDGNLRVGSTIFGNILWLIPGLIVDFATGSAYELQDQIKIAMEKCK